MKTHERSIEQNKADIMKKNPLKVKVNRNTSVKKPNSYSPSTPMLMAMVANQRDEGLPAESNAFGLSVPDEISLSPAAVPSSPTVNSGDNVPNPDMEGSTYSPNRDRGRNTRRVFDGYDQYTEEKKRWKYAIETFLKP